MPKKIVTVHFSGGPSVPIERGSTIMAAAKAGRVEIESFCGESCSCSTCKVLVLDGKKRISKMNNDERSVLGDKQSEKGYRLSCQSQVNGDITVEVPTLF